MLPAILLSAILASNASGKALVRQQQGTLVPSSGYKNVFDDFSSNTSANYTSSGTWAISSGRLRNTTAGDGQAWLRDSVVASDMKVQAIVQTASTSARFPCIVLRAADVSNLTFILVGPNVLRVYDRIAGVDTQRGADITTTINTGVDYTIVAEIIGTTVRVSVDGGAVTERTVTRVGRGKGGVRIGSASGSLEVQFDNLTITGYR